MFQLTIMQVILYPAKNKKTCHLQSVATEIGLST